jgi:uncharacterized membrane protein YphA (DoxX/SURF4 family)
MQCLLSRFTGPQKAEWLLRWALAVFFFLSGFGKIMGGVSAFVYQMTPGFEDTFLPLGLVAGFFGVVLFLELLLGVFLFVGLRREFTLWLTGLLIILFLFGHKLQGDGSVMMPMFVYLLVVSATLYLPAAWNVACPLEKKCSKK